MISLWNHQNTSLGRDGVIRSYGDQLFCAEWKPTIEYDPVVTALSTPFLQEHTYWYLTRLLNTYALFLMFIIFVLKQ